MCPTNPTNPRLLDNAFKAKDTYILVGFLVRRHGRWPMHEPWRCASTEWLLEFMMTPAHIDQGMVYPTAPKT